MSMEAALTAHLAQGVTTVCRCWALTRADGMTMGFTDHDRDLTFEGVVFRPDSGLSASALVQTTGLAVDNTEALGALSDAGLSSEDIRAGRYDGARIVCWLVNWAAVSQRMMQFRGSLGEIREEAGVFRAELRGLSEALNQKIGFVFQRPCSAVLGDARCGVDLTAPGYTADLTVETVSDNRVFRFSSLGSYDAGWFSRGRLRMTSGAASGLVGLVKADRDADGFRIIELWESFRAPVVPGDALSLQTGCDRRPITCRKKFANFLNFRGFPHVPGEDWLMSYPRAGSTSAAARGYKDEPLAEGDDV